jgi:hypothetical protein
MFAAADMGKGLGLFTCVSDGEAGSVGGDFTMIANLSTRFSIERGVV